ncbi:MAG: hypothetical protein JWO98_4744 [Frankiales bacterium]|nr:hypothetical protein [Frankiales bacterium]
MNSLSWTQEPRREPDEYQWGSPLPDGYEWPGAGLTVGLFVVCQTCVASIAPNLTERHTEWHASL